MKKFIKPKASIAETQASKPLGLKVAATLALSVAVIAASSSGCSPADVSTSSKLNRLMVLGLMATPTAIQNPTGGVVTVALDPYLSDLAGTGTISLRIQSCVDPGKVNGEQQDCTNAQNPSVIQDLVVSAPANTPVGYFGMPERTGRLYSGAIQVPLNIPADFLASYTAAQRFNGVPYLIWVKVTSPKETIHAFRQIMISNQLANQNPDAADIVADGAPISSLPAKDVELELAAASGPESYQKQNNDGTVQAQTEVLETAWYVSDGTLSAARTRLGLFSKWTPPSEKPGGRGVLLIGVLQDNRGGVDIVTKKF